MTDEEVFARAIGLGPDQRASFLSDVCSGNPRRKSRLAGLIEAHFQSDSLLGSEAIESTSAIQSDSLGTQVGPYKLLQVLGEGGMGVVYLAERLEPVKQRVALKIIKSGMDSKKFIARFEAERQALAMMDHPHIAKVFDAGTTASGRPYFVMELVKGIPITKFCDDNGVNARERIGLLLAVCHAVQHAHQKGIIHRDLKPSNVLVAMYDDKPVPKVIDFGLAKAANQQLTDKTLFTEVGSILGTWEYMSPEQAVLNQLDVDTRTDVYSLGVILYELMTGVTPIDRKRLRSVQLQETLRIIQEEEPPRPSTRLSYISSHANSLSKYRTANLQEFDRFVRGDLDWITMKALDKDRKRRYESASRFAEDLENFLSGDVVEARPPTLGYRFQKFAKRNRSLLATVGTIAIVLVIASLVSFVALFVAIEQKDEAVKQKGIALAKALEAEDAKQCEEKRATNLTMGHAFQALSDGDLDRLGNLLDVLSENDQATKSFEFRLLKEQLARHNPVLSVNQGYIDCGAFADDNTLLVGYRDSPKIEVFDPTDWQRSSTLRAHSSDAKWQSTATILNRKGRGILIGGKLADGRGGLASLSMDSRVVTIDKTFDSEVVAICSADEVLCVATRDGRVRRIDENQDDEWEQQFNPHAIETGSSNQHQSPVLVATNGRLVAVADNDSPIVRLLDASTGEEVLQPQDLESHVRGMTFSADGNELLIAFRLEIAFFRIEGDELVSQRSINARSHDVTISEATGQLASADAFGGIRLYNTGTLHQVNRLVAARGVSSVSVIKFSSDGRLLFASDAFGNAKVWDLNRVDPATAQTKSSANSFQYVETNSDNRVAYWSADKASLNLWDAAAQEITVFHDDRATVGAIAFSPDGKFVAVAGDAVGTVGHAMLVVWDVNDPSQPYRSFQTLSKEVRALAFVSNHRLAVSGRSTGETDGATESDVLIWDMETEEVQRLWGKEDGNERFISLDVSHDGRYLIAGGGKWTYYQPEEKKGLTVLWDLASKSTQPIRRIEHELMVYAVDFHPNSYVFAAAGLDTVVKVGAIDREEIDEFSDKAWWITGLAFTPDGERLVTASPQQVTFWDYEQREQTGTFCLDDQVRRIRFLPDNSGMVTASAEGNIRVWKALEPMKAN